MHNVRYDREPHPSHKFGPWEKTIVSLPNADRFGQKRECECGAVDIKAGGAGSRWFADGADKECWMAGEK